MLRNSVAVITLLAGTTLGTALLAQDVKGADLKVGLVLKTLANPYWVAIGEGAQARADELGAKITILAATDESAIEEQTTITQTMAGQEFNCVAAAPISNTNLIAPLAAATAAGKAVVLMNAVMPEFAAGGVKVATYIGVRNQDAGAAAAQDMLAKLGAGAKVAVVGGLAGNADSAARLDGFKAALGGMDIVQEVAADWDREKALNAADAILRSNPDVKGFYAANDGMAMGIQQAINNAGMQGKVLVYGTDAVPDAVASVEAGQLAGTAAQFPWVMGGMMVDGCLAALQGATIEESTVAPVALISSENVAAALAAAPKPWFEYQSPLASLLK
jgi:ABC-type sugar transport system substrate-binding protein